MLGIAIAGSQQAVGTLNLGNLGYTVKNRFANKKNKCHSETPPLRSSRSSY